MWGGRRGPRHLGKAGKAVRESVVDAPYGGPAESPITLEAGPVDDPENTRRSPPPVHGVRRALWLTAFAAILFGIKLYFIGAYGNATPFWDQWSAEGNALYKPLVEGQFDWGKLVAPHVVHRILMSRLLAVGLFCANGMWNPLLQMVVNAALWVGVIVLLVVLLNRATGHRHLLLLLAFALVTFGLPYGNENMLWGFQSLFYFFVLWSTLALWAIAVSPPFGAGWWAGIACGLLGFYSLGSGAFTAAAAMAVAATQYATGVRRGKLQLASIGVLAVLFVAGVVLTASRTSRDGLEATSPGQMLTAWMLVAAWPLKIGLPGPVIAQWPACALAWTMLRRPPAARDPRWFLLAAAAGALGQGVAISYGRAAGSLASRYQDLFALGLIVNFACGLAAFPVFAARMPLRAVAAMVVWVGLIAGSLAIHTHRHAIPEMEFRRVSGAAQQAHTRDYIFTGKVEHLLDKPWLHVPYPRTDRLVAMLDDPTIRSFLPPAIAPPLAATDFGCEPAAAFLPGGTAPDVEPRAEPTWGSHGPACVAITGSATIAFDSPHRGYAVDLPVVAGGDVHGVGIEVEQDGQRQPVPIPEPISDGVWMPVRIKVHGKPFTIHVADRTPAGWVAVAAPTAEGRFERHVRRLLARWDSFVLAGLVLVTMLIVDAGLMKPPD